MPNRLLLLRASLERFPAAFRRRRYRRHHAGWEVDASSSNAFHGIRRVPLTSFTLAALRDIFIRARSDGESSASLALVPEISHYGPR